MVIKIQNNEYKINFQYRVLEEFCNAIDVPDITDLTQAVMVAVGGFNLKVCAKLVYYGIKSESNINLDEVYDILEAEPYSMEKIITPIAKTYYQKVSEMQYGKQVGKQISDAICKTIDEERKKVEERAKKKLQTMEK